MFRIATPFLVLQELKRSLISTVEIVAHRGAEYVTTEKKVFSSMYENITKIALKGIALAMSVLKTLDINTGINMLGIGLALANFQE